MSPQGKVDLGAKAEAMLASWPAPSSDDAAWESRAAKIVAAATSAPRADDAQIAVLLAKPALESEPGENQSVTVSAAINARSASGEKAMSDSNPGSPSKPSSPAAAKRPSLKELAARASQAGASSTSTTRPSAPTPPPPAVDTVLQDKQSRPSQTPIPAAPVAKASVPPPRPVEAGKEDSGRVDLNAINKAATPEQVAAAAVAKPAAHDLVDDAKAEDKPAAAADAGEGAKVKNISEARAKKSAKKKSEAAKTNETAKESDAAPAAAAAEPAAKKAESESGGGGKWAIMAVLALAAGGFLYWKNKQQPPAPVAAVVQEKPDTTPVVTDTQKIAAPEEPKPSTGLSIDSLPSEPSAKTPAKVAAAAPEENLAPAPAPTPEPAAPTALPTASAGGKKPGDLSSAMAEAVGGSTDKPVNADDATPAAAKTGSQTVPEQPPQGSVASAIRSVAPGAKACVAGADEPSNASITFSSSGTVSSVSVSGWAAKNGKTECVKAALKGANVGPFAKPTYVVSVPIRP